MKTYSIQKHWHQINLINHAVGWGGGCWGKKIQNEGAEEKLKREWKKEQIASETG